MCNLLTVATYQTSSLLGRKKELDGLSIGNPQGLAQGARQPVAWSDDVKELLSCTWRGDPQQRCSAGHAAGVLTRLEVSGGPDPLAANMACCVIA